MSAEQIEEVKKLSKIKDFYELLGVTKDATDDQIKKAYRKLALKFHPDKNKAEGSKELFKTIAEAYDCLTSAEKRAAYDRYGTNKPEEQYRQNFHSDVRPEDIFNMFFSQAGGGSGGGSDFFRSSMQDIFSGAANQTGGGAGPRVFFQSFGGPQGFTQTFNFGGSGADGNPFASHGHNPFNDLGSLFSQLNGNQHSFNQSRSRQDPLMNNRGYQQQQQQQQQQRQRHQQQQRHQRNNQQQQSSSTFWKYLPIALIFFAYYFMSSSGTSSNSSNSNNNNNYNSSSSGNSSYSSLYSFTKSSDYETTRETKQLHVKYYTSKAFLDRIRNDPPSFSAIEKDVEEKHTQVLQVECTNYQTQKRQISAQIEAARSDSDRKYYSNKLQSIFTSACDELDSYDRILNKKYKQSSSAA